MPKAIALVRVSTEEQAAEDRAGLPAQRVEIERIAAAHGLAIVEWVELHGVSGAAVLSDPRFDALLSRLRSQTNLLELRSVLFDGVGLLLLVFVFNLAVIEDSTDRRVRTAIDLNEIEIGIFRDFECFFQRKNPLHISFSIDHTYGLGFDFFVNIQTLGDFLIPPLSV